MFKTSKLFVELKRATILGKLSFNIIVIELFKRLFVKATKYYISLNKKKY